MASPIRYLSGLIGDWGRDWGRRNLMGEGMANRMNMYDLYSDPDWMLQAGLGDIEFEQDMYDDIVYGEPVISKKFPGPTDFNETLGSLLPHEWSNKLKAIPDAPYDELALQGLRKHAMEGGDMRYMDMTPFDVGEYEEPWDDESSYTGVYHPTSWGPEGEEGPNIDINPNYVLREPHKGSLQDKISDLYRHEYKHGIIPHHTPYSHAAIYGTNAKYGISPDSVAESLYRFSEGPHTYDEDYFGRPVPTGGHSRAAGMTHPFTSPPAVDLNDVLARSSTISPQDRAGDVARFYIGGGQQREPDVPTSGPRGSGPRGRRTHHFNTGGLVSLVI